MADITYFWEDMAVGQVRDLGTISPSREDIIAFASQFDPQPFHLDDAAGAASVFGGFLRQRLAHLLHGHALDGDEFFATNL